MSLENELHDLLRREMRLEEELDVVRTRVTVLLQGVRALYATQGPERGPEVGTDTPAFNSASTAVLPRPLREYETYVETYVWRPGGPVDASWAASEGSNPAGA